MSQKYEYKAVGKERFETLEKDKSFYINLAIDCCKYTLPIMRSYFEEVYNRELSHPYQSLGAAGVSNLASKLLTALTPSNTPFFKFIVDDYKLLETRQEESEDFRIVLETILADYANQTLDIIKASNDTSFLYEMWQLLLISGNVLIRDPDDNGNIRIYSLRDYVVSRDRAGNPVEIILKEVLSENAWTDEIRAVVNNSILPSDNYYNKPSDKTDEKEVELYSYCKRCGDKYYIHQEVRGVILENTKQEVSLEGCPFIALRLFNGAGEDYSRSYVSNYLGDLKSLDGLSQASVEAAAMISRNILLVDPTGITDKDDIEEAENGEVIDGRAGDVSFLQAQKGYDLRTVTEEVSKIEERLNRAFLITGGMIRDAERVTREEVREVAKEIEQSLGGLYSACSYSFQVPYLKRKIYKLAKMKLLPKLDSAIKPVIIAGFEALGTNSQKEELLEFAGYLREFSGGALQTYAKPLSLIKKLASIMNISIDGIIKTDEELAAEQEQQSQMQLQQQQMDIAKSAIPAAISNMPALQQVAEQQQ